MNKKSGTFFDQVALFNRAAGNPKGNILDRPDFAAIARYRKLIEEEWEIETKTAIAKYINNPSTENLAEVGDGIVDSIYVLCGLAYVLGLPLNKLWDEVQNANMAKCVTVEDPDGTRRITVRRREDGKILKPEGWQPPNILQILMDFSNDESQRQGRFGGENWPKLNNVAEEQ